MFFLFLGYDNLSGDTIFVYNSIVNNENSISLKLFPFLIPYIYVLKYFYNILGDFHFSFIFLNILFELVTLYFYLKLIKEKYDNTKNWFVFVWLFNPFNICFSVLGLNIILFNMCLVIFLYFVNKFFNFKSTGNKNIIFISILLSILMALANSVRPIMIIFIIALIIIIILLLYKINNIKLMLKYIISIFIIPILFSFNFKYINNSIYNVINSEVVENVGGWNIFVGSNYKYSGGWNSEDANYFNEKLRKNNNYSQVLEELRDEGIDRYFSYTNKQKTLLIIKKFDKLVYFATTPYNLFSYSSINKIKEYIAPIFSYYGLLLVLISLLKTFRLLKRDESRNFYDLFLITSFNGLLIAFLFVEVSNRYFIPMMLLLIIYSLDEWNNFLKNLLKFEIYFNKFRIFKKK